jgi:hypothetical protein
VKRALALPVVFLALALARPVAAQPAAKWSEFKSRACRCSALLPGSPREQKQTYPTEVGPVDATLYILEVDEGKVAYLVGYNDYPKDKVKGFDKQKMLDGAKKGAVNNVQGKLVAEKTIELSGFPGLEIEVDAGASKVFVRIVVAEERLYQALVVMPAAATRPAHVRKFLDSIKLAKK